MSLVQSSGSIVGAALSVFSLLQYLLRRVRCRLSRQFSPQSLDVITQKVESAKHQIAAGTFKPPIVFIKPAARLFTLVPLPTFKRRYVRLDKAGMMTVLNHFGLSKHLPLPSNPPTSNVASDANTDTQSDNQGVTTAAGIETLSEKPYLTLTVRLVFSILPSSTNMALLTNFAKNRNSACQKTSA
ncbi:hypothetical protein DM01DRAFT_1341652 [Hesseltinella vesiculosa]|uniref:Uncharacterized protein n=1 Tax=Hesseltinella vesiculosa TaxID=101127 RepID=A0A1X2GYD0_9FUNG|nr:hypothetical protein DM01DRAFT_1341652 [Hesseltinella vesiculosa]